ncbi:GTPase Era [Candidatus Xenohaliotis californiensis]|uniref:GTPase Era n=1 Tax=Candidatus Xenohaliotis californiensis TaxID=84677 RepID=A0ABP0EVC4_9RICK|nr:GTPase Era [Candidatus Xenohaliotis californiensis]
MQDTKVCTVTLLGPTNAGKSTMLNWFVGERISVVTPKVQTTRQKIRAIYTKGDTQLIFIDAPGIFKTKKIIEKFMVNQAWDALLDGDIVLLVVDVKKGLDSNLRSTFQRLSSFADSRMILVLNKVDLVHKPKLLPIIAELSKLHSFEKVFMVSATKGDGMNGLLLYLESIATPSPWLYEPDSMTDVSSSFFATEVTRKHLLMALERELPYALNVEGEKWEESDSNVIIHQVIYVKSERHRKIVIGANGNMLKIVGVKARRELSYLLDKNVSLYLFVKVFPKWEVDFVNKNLLS